jgi:hypothetical protein
MALFSDQHLRALWPINSEIQNLEIDFGTKQINCQLVSLLVQYIFIFYFNFNFIFNNFNHLKIKIKDQLAEIRKMSLSKLLCRNLRDTPRIQPRAMISSKLKE